MEQPQQMGEPDSRPLFVEIAVLCPACNGCGVTNPIQEACIYCDGEPSGCWNCGGLGYVDAYPICERCDGSGCLA